MDFKYKRMAVLFIAATFMLAGCKNREDTRKKEDVKEQQIVEAAAKENTEETITKETAQQTESETIPETTQAEIESETISETTQAEAESETVAEALNPDDYVSFLFAGDVCLEEDGFVIDYYDEVGGDLTQCVSPYLLERMRSADIFMLNHEYSISDRGSRLEKYYTFRANPSRMNILKEMDVDIVSLANNHVYDYGYDAFEDTLRLLDENGIRRVGAGMNLAEAEQVQYFEVNGIKIGVVSASRAEKYVITPQAKENEPGVFWMYDDTRLKEVCNNADGQCDFLIAYVHWGTEESCYFEEYQQEIARELVDCGVDAIIGGHPHIVQGMEYIEDVPVLYSLGDFWFNGSDKYSMMVQLNIYRDGRCEVDIVPCRQKDYGIHYIENQEEQKEFFDYFSELSPGVIFG